MKEALIQTLTNLKSEVEQHYEPEKVAQDISLIFHKNMEYFPSNLRNVVIELMTMDMDECFIMPHEECLFLIDKLIKGINNQEPPQGCSSIPTIS